MNDDLEKMYLDVIEDNVNVSKTSDIKEFFILLAGLAGIVFIVFLFTDIFSSAYISHMSDATQMKIEHLLGTLPKDEMFSEKYKKPYTILLNSRKKIIQNDKSLKSKSTFPIIIKEDEEFNAYVMPNGVINFTTKLLDKDLTEEELTFILAHEIGHYKNRDHLKSISRQITATMILQLLTGGNGDMNSLVRSMSDINYLSHSRKQEINADKYASQMSILIYGNNNGGLSFFKKLEDIHKSPEFFSYFSTHPSTNKRIKLLQKYNKNLPKK